MTQVRHFAGDAKSVREIVRVRQQARHQARGRGPIYGGRAAATEAGALGRDGA